MTARRALAWVAHLYTGMGLVLAAIAAVMIVRGDAEALRWALIALAVATLVDATDGTLARAVDVRGALPGFDGRRLDDIIDFQTYTSLPLLLIWRSGVLPPEQAPWLLLPLLASAYGFSQVDVKTADGYFLGFPSYWNVVALYLHLLRPAPVISLVTLIVLALLTFLPTKYPYPSQPGALNRLALVLAIPWGIVLALVLAGAVRDAETWLAWSLVYPAFYVAAGFAVSTRRHRDPSN